VHTQYRLEGGISRIPRDTNGLFGYQKYLRVLHSLTWYSRLGSRLKPLTIQEETLRDLLLQQDCHKSMGPDEIHPRVLRWR